MALTQENVDALAENLVEQKERQFLEDPNDCDVMPALQTYGFTGPLLTVNLFGVERTMIPQVMIPASLASPDFMVHLGESYQYAVNKDEMEDPSKIPDLEPGTLSKWFKEGHPQVHEALMAQAMDHEGNYAFVTIPFIKREGRLDWVEPRHVDLKKQGEDGIVGHGYMYDALARVMTAKTIADVMAEQGMGFESFGLTRRESELHLACVAAKMLVPAEIQCAFALANDDEIELVETSMKEINANTMGFRV